MRLMTRPGQDDIDKEAKQDGIDDVDDVDDIDEIDDHDDVGDVDDSDIAFLRFFGCCTWTDREEPGGCLALLSSSIGDCLDVLTDCHLM